MKGFKKDGKFRPTDNKKKSSLKKSDVRKKENLGRTTRLDKYTTVTDFTKSPLPRVKKNDKCADCGHTSDRHHNYSGNDGTPYRRDARGCMYQYGIDDDYAEESYCDCENFEREED